MKHSELKRKIRAGFAALLMLGASLPAAAQNPFNRRLYDKARDDAAQKAAEAAAKLASGSLFDKEMKNLDAMGALEIDSVFQGERRGMRDSINELALGVWSAIDSRIDGLFVETAIESVAEEMKSLQTQKDAMQLRSEKLKPRVPALAVPDNPADTLAGILANGGDVEAVAKAVVGISNGKTTGQLTEISGTIGKAMSEAATAAQAVAANQKKAIDVIQQLRQLETSLNDIAEQRFQLKIDHLQTQIDIKKRALGEMRFLKELVDGYRKQSMDLPDHSRTVIDTVQGASGQKENGKTDPVLLTTALDCSYLAAAIFARWNSAELTAKLRNAIEDHRDSIRSSQLEAHAYEVAIGSGAQRLALFYKGGVHPETIAQLIYTAATAAIPWSISTTK